jgi:hypothetical protein
MVISMRIFTSEIELKSETTYSTGNDVTISCVFSFTKGGIGPTSVEWSQIENLKMSDEYLPDLGKKKMRCNSISHSYFHSSFRISSEL